MTTPSTCRARRGGAYILVVLSCASCAIAGLAMLSLTRSLHRTASIQNDAAEARRLARAGVDLGLLMVSQDEDWRTNLSPGAWVTELDAGEGTVSLEAIDPVDGDFADSLGDPLVLRGAGRCGDAVQILEVTLDPTQSSLPCLDTSMTADGNVTFNTVTVTADNVIAANGQIGASGSQVWPNVEAIGLMTGSTYLGTRTTVTTPRTVPADTVFDSYIAAGTAIPVTSLASNVMQNVLLSPASNPYGSPNPQGIYYIDCLSRRVIIRNCRIVGTLVLLNTRSGSRTEPSVVMETTSAHMPVLLVRGPFRIETGSILSELTTLVNFNPPDTPYEGASNILPIDTFPAKVKGLVYISGAARTQNIANLHGTLVGGSIVLRGTTTSVFDPLILATPPEGFEIYDGVQVTPGTWRRGVEE